MPSSSRASVRSNRASLMDVDLSQNWGNNCILPDREVMTCDLAALDEYVAQLKTHTRLPTESPFHQAFWTRFRDVLKRTDRGNGFRTNLDPDSFQLMDAVKSNEHMQRIMQDQIVLLCPMHGGKLAEAWGIPLAIVLTELFYATKVGLLDMIWAPKCDMCGGTACTRTDLSKLPPDTYCDQCSYENKVDCLDNVKVIFVLSNDVLYFPVHNGDCPFIYAESKLPYVAFAGASHPTLNRSGYGYEFGGQDPNLPALEPASYLVYCPFSKFQLNLVVEETSPEGTDPLYYLLRVSEWQRPAPGIPTRTLTIPHGRVRFDVLCDTGSATYYMFYKDAKLAELMKVEDTERIPYASGTSVIHHPSFQRLFPRQIVGEASLLTVKRVILVFTDVVGSTALYETYGDAVALEAVRSHFRILFATFATSARLVKTVGDAVMAAFTCGEAAIAAVAQALKDLESDCKLPDGSPLRIRVGIHGGSALMVPLNGINDYFGSVVNTAARIEGKAVASECLVSSTVLKEPGANEAFAGLSTGGFSHTRQVQLTLKGIDEPIEAKGFGWNL